MMHTVRIDREQPHVQHLYNAPDIDSFERSIDILASRYEFVPLHEWCKSQSKVAHISFDDGFQECYTHIAPLLLRKGISATFFINTSFVDNTSVMTRCKASWVWSQLGSFPHNLQKEDVLTAKEDILDEIINSYGLPYKIWLESYRPYMTITQIKKLHKQGFTIGAHSHTHPRFEDLTYDEMKQEIKDSVEYIRLWTGAASLPFSFPFTDEGVSKEIFTWMYSEDVGVIASFGISGLKRDELAQHYHRIPVEDSNLDIVARISSEGLAHKIRTFVGISIRKH